MSIWHVLGLVVVAAVYLRERYESRHPVVHVGSDVHTQARWLYWAWWTRRQQLLNQVCEARVVSRKPNHDAFWAYSAEKEARQSARHSGNVVDINRRRHA